MVMPNDRQIDDAIDRAVREMMSVDPPAGLRARVLARLDDRSRREWSLLTLLGAGAAVAVALVVLLLVWRAPERGEPEMATSRPAPESPVPARPAPEPPVRMPAPPPTTPERPAADSRPRLARSPIRSERPDRLQQEILAANAVVDLETGPEALEAIPEIDVGHVAPSDIDTPFVSVSPLSSLRRLQIDPLPPPGSQN
jgi:hypothetical protein